MKKNHYWEELIYAIGAKKKPPQRSRISLRVDGDEIWIYTEAIENRYCQGWDDLDKKASDLPRWEIVLNKDGTWKIS